MTAIFRTTAAVTQTASQAMAGAGVLVLVLVIYTGYVIRVPEMPVYFGWLRYVDHTSPLLPVSVRKKLTSDTDISTRFTTLSKFSSPMSSTVLTSLVTALSPQAQAIRLRAIHLYAILRVQLLGRRSLMVTRTSKLATPTRGHTYGG